MISADHPVYDFKEKIGNGSFGEVWLVKNRKTGKKCVLKKLNLCGCSAVEQKRAVLESQLLATLRHPNIVTYYDSFFQSQRQNGGKENGETLNIVMCFCEGGDLYKHIRKRNGNPIDESQIVEWLIQLCMALKYLNDKKILHRDLKTKNIFLTRKGLIKLGDFGIARVLDGTQDMAATLIGTPYYMSPEILTGAPYNHKSDIWSLGCCIYEMASLKHAFRAQNFNCLLYKVLQCKPPEIPSDYSRELSALTSAMLCSDPENRPSAQNLLENTYIRSHIFRFLAETKHRAPSSCNKTVQSSGKDCGEIVARKECEPESSPTNNTYILESHYNPPDIGNERKQEENVKLKTEDSTLNGGKVCPDCADALRTHGACQNCKNETISQPTGAPIEQDEIKTSSAMMTSCHDPMYGYKNSETVKPEVTRYTPSEARLRRRKQMQKCSVSVDSLETVENPRTNNPMQCQQRNKSARQRRRERLSVMATNEAQETTAKLRPKSAPSRLTKPCDL